MNVVVMVKIKTNRTEELHETYFVEVYANQGWDGEKKHLVYEIYIKENDKHDEKHQRLINESWMSERTTSLALYVFKLFSFSAATT